MHVHAPQVYHFIRGQNVIKLYVLCSMMEIMDKLLRCDPETRPPCCLLT